MHETTVGGTIRKVGVPLKEGGMAVYKSSFQLPYSYHTLYLKIFDDGHIFFRFSTDEENNWLWWDGSKHSYHILKKDCFPHTTKWHVEYEIGLVEQFVSLSYQASLAYFKNIITSGCQHEN